MPGKIDLYAFGEAGVNVVDSVVHVATNQLRRAQNAQWTPQEEQKGLCLRPGMQPLNEDAMSGSILALFPIPFADPMVPVPPGLANLAYIAADGPGYKWRETDDGSTWTDGIAAPESPNPWFSQAGNVPDASGRTIWRATGGTVYAYDGLTNEALFDDTDPPGFTGISGHALTAAGDGVVVVALDVDTAGDPGVAIFDFATEAFTLVGGSAPSLGAINNRIVVAGQSLWVVMPDGDYDIVYRVGLGLGGTWEALTTTEFEDNSILGIAVIGNDILLTTASASAGARLFKWDGSTFLQQGTAITEGTGTRGFDWLVAIGSSWYVRYGANSLSKIFVSVDDGANWTESLNVYDTVSASAFDAYPTVHLGKLVVAFSTGIWRLDGTWSEVDTTNPVGAWGGYGEA